MRFNANEVPPADSSFAPLPDGDYDVRVERSIECDNKNRTGKYLEIVVIVTEGPSKGRKIWARYTTEHENEQAASIGRGQISAALRALGRPVVDHESEIIGCVGKVRVGREKNDPERNEIKRWIAPTDMRGAPTYSNVHQRAGAAQHNVHREAPGPVRGGAATVPANRQPPPPPDDMPGFFDEDVPF